MTVDMISNKDKKLKILIVNYEYPPIGGGGGVMTQKLAKALVKKGHTVHVLTSGTTGLAKKTDEHGVKVFRVPVLFRKDINAASNLSMFSFPMTSIPRGLLLCLRYRYDIINTHFYAPTGPTGMVLSLLTRIPNVLYIHGADVYDPTRLGKTPAGKGFLSLLLRLSARMQNLFARGDVACQSSNTKENIETYIGTKKPVRVIPLPFEKPVHPKFTRRGLGLDEKKFYIISAGRAVARKGYGYLVAAMKEIDGKIHCLILGDGPEIPGLKELARSLGVASRVTFLGYIEREEDKYKYYAASDMYVLSSIHEGMGIVVQEAMEFGLPVVATNHGGQVDLIKDGTNGILVNPADAGALAGAVNALYRNRAMRKTFSKNNRDIIKNYYAANIADEFLKWFREALRK